MDIVIVNWNSGDMLGKCLSSFQNANLDGVNYHIIVIDNNSSDDSLKDIEEKNLPVKLVRNEQNIGFGAACNQGASLGKSDYILFLNPDTILTENSIKPPLLFINSHKEIGIVGIQLCDESGNVQRSCARYPSLKTFSSKIFGWDRFSKKSGHYMLEWDHSESKEVDQVMGAYFLVRRSLFEELKGFDERYFVYFEEVDFAYRSFLKGHKSYYYSDSQVYHIGQGTTKNIKARRLYYSLTSRIKYFAKHKSKTKALIILFLSLFVEPLTRVGINLLKGSLGEVKNIVGGYKMIYKDKDSLIKILKES